MATIEEGIEIDVSVRAAYNQWTQFEEFPKFMEGVEKVTQLDDERLHWEAEIAGQRREWEARITEQLPDERVAWYGIGTTNGGVVTFHRLDDNRCKVMLQLEYDPQDWVEKAGDVLGIVRRRVRGDLQRFKEFMESRGQEPGAWRGEIAQEKG